ncbi:Zn-ribbon domain-containing OB-fold protein [Hydrogenophaga sp. BPS33]|uniref:Zn-ribbon domain-containing OB-fold protein n=1 Tax=Hydrogenophaga sp. BPS33 TaxID=2651974 RepID=UPI0013204677|nr:OB-fold domain-containing protein [Hydrogenophaga sp. BPS33]QHE83692.1 hypothetical protein F9K07_01760 [Hydrogenophaga sp. BPS33]
MSDMRPEADFTGFLAQGKFMIQRSRTSGRHIFHPRVVEPGTGSTDLEWVEASGHGTVYSTTTLMQRPPTPNLNIALIDLAEGPRMLARVDGVPSEDVRIGMPVRARVIEENGQHLVVFVPESQQ